MALLEKIKNKQSKIAIIGLGYVGLPLAQRFVEVGFHVYGFDVSEKKVNQLKAGNTYIRHFKSETIKLMNATKRFEPTSKPNDIKDADAYIICVPTPLGQHQDPDVSYIKSAVETIQPFLRPGVLVSLESTTYPGTTDEEIVPALEAKGLKVGKDAFVVFSPEREDPGNKHFGTKTIPKVVGGVTPACTEVGAQLYSSVIDKVVQVSSTKVAEMSKLLENIYRSVNIGLVNELKVVCDRMGINIWEVVHAASTKPFGFVPFYPGPGLGGHCIPIDPFYLTWKAREYGIHTRFIELAGEINTAMPEWVTMKVVEALNSHGRSVKGAKILVLGVAYKKNIDDCRESPALQIIKLLRGKGADVHYSDPFVPNLDDPELHIDFTMKAHEFSQEAVSWADCVVIATDHDDFNYELLKKNAKLIVDTRGRYKEASERVVLA